MKTLRYFLTRSTNPSSKCEVIQMQSYAELILIFVLLFLIAGPIGFVRYKLYSRFVQSQESIAESLRKLAEGQAKSH